MCLQTLGLEATVEGFDEPVVCWLLRLLLGATGVSAKWQKATKCIAA
jgi:hypothetical protein